MKKIELKDDIITIENCFECPFEKISKFRKNRKCCGLTSSSDVEFLIDEDSIREDCPLKEEE